MLALEVANGKKIGTFYPGSLNLLRMHFEISAFISFKNCRPIPWSGSISQLIAPVT
jgi:hypothetical protein